MTDGSEIRLGEIAHARSGDKGNHANIGVIAYTQLGFEYLREQLTPERVAKFFSQLGGGPVERYELPNVGALNFVLRNVLAGGASQSLRIDTQGKTLATALLELPLPRPAGLENMVRSVNRTTDAALPATQPDAPAPALPMMRLSPTSEFAPLVLCDVTDGVAYITLNRPAKRNALSRALLCELSAAVEQAESDESVRALVLRAEGPAFCAGMDLAEMQATAAAQDAVQIWREDAHLYGNVLDRMVRMGKPVIGSVHGPALAGGAGLVLACDVVVAAESARFGLPEVKRGIVAAVVTPFLLLRATPGIASYLLLTGRVITANRAHELGLFHEVVPTSQLSDRTEATVRDVLEGAPGALATTKRFWLDGAGAMLVERLPTACEISAAARATPEARAKLAAFLAPKP